MLSKQLKEHTKSHHCCIKAKAEPLQVSQCEKCGKLLAEPKELIGIVKEE